MNSLQIIAQYASQAAQGIQDYSSHALSANGSERQYFQTNIKQNEIFTDAFISDKLKKASSIGHTNKLLNFDEEEILDLLKRLFAKLLLNTKNNLDYQSVSKFFPEIILSLHNQPPYMKKYSFFILSQIYWTQENKQKNCLLPVNILDKDTKSSCPVIRADAIRLLTDMCSNLSDIFPFLYEIVKSGCNDLNPYVVQVSLICLIKLFENTEISLCDYAEDIRDSIFQKHLINNYDMTSFTQKQI